MRRIITRDKKAARAALFSALVLAAAALALYQGATALDYRWRWQRLPRYFWRQTADGGWSSGPLLDGLLLTLQLSLAAGVFALIIGAGVAAARLAAYPSLRLLARVYTEFMRCTPLLVQLYLFYFMFGNVLRLPPFTAGAVSLALFEAAFAAEIMRAGYMSVPQGQADAARAAGLSRRQSLRLVLLPQSLPLMLPPLANLGVSLIKHSSVVTIIAIADLTDAARNLVAETFLVFEIWLAVGALYVGICLPLALLIGRWERRLRAAKGGGRR